MINGKLHFDFDEREDGVDMAVDCNLDISNHPNVFEVKLGALRELVKALQFDEMEQAFAVFSLDTDTWPDGRQIGQKPIVSCNPMFAEAADELEEGLS